MGRKLMLFSILWCGSFLFLNFYFMLNFNVSVGFRVVFVGNLLVERLWCGFCFWSCSLVFVVVCVFISGK